MTATTKKIKMPDGKGGWIEQDAEVHSGSQADADKQQAAMEATFINEAGSLTERIMQFDVLYIKDHGLSKEHRAFAGALYCVNLRETYPDGPEAFDRLAESAAKYYDENKDKVV